MCGAQGVNPGLLVFRTFLPYPSAANGGGGVGEGLSGVGFFAMVSVYT